MSCSALPWIIAPDYFISGSKTEAGRNRVIPVCPIGQTAYTQLLQRAKEQGAKRLIDAYTGNKTATNFAKRDFRDLMSEIGAVDMTPYNCRHTFSTLAVRAGVKPELLQKIMGHADYSTTVGVYTHLDKDDIVAAAKGHNGCKQITSKPEIPKRKKPKVRKTKKIPGNYAFPGLFLVTRWRFELQTHCLKRQLLCQLS